MGDHGWTRFYMAFADALPPYKARRGELLADAFNEIHEKNPFKESGVDMTDVCPFTAAADKGGGANG